MTTSFASTPRVTVAHASHPSSSGDCARVIVREGGELLCFLADVSGHGPAAAMLARDLDSRLAGLAANATCGSIMTALNTMLAASWPTDCFASAVCFAFDTWTGSGTIAVAGQLPPIVKRGVHARPLEAVRGPALGLVRHHRYRETAFFLGPEDALVAVTDGITDPLASASDLLGVETATRMLCRISAEPNRICTALMEAAGHQGFRDDATVLVAMHRPYDLAGLTPTVLDLAHWHDRTRRPARRPRSSDGPTIRLASATPRAWSAPCLRPIH